MNHLRRFVSLDRRLIIMLVMIGALVMVMAAQSAAADGAAPQTAAAITSMTVNQAASASVHEDATTAPIPPIWWIAPVGSVLALIFAVYFYRKMKAADPGTETMQGIAKDVRDGAMAYLGRQYRVLLIFFVIIMGFLFLMSEMHLQHWLVPFAFITGGFFSGLCGFLGMWTATFASNRTAAAARDPENGLNRGLQVAFRSGAVMGLVVVGFGLIDICAWFLLLKTGMLGPMDLEEITVVMLCFGMGASAQALFARVGGGIYTKAADVGADLVGKVEAGIPEDDPRNPATIADNVGDNVGDVAGMGADLYESYCGSILASAALGVASVAYMTHKGVMPGQANEIAKTFGGDEVAYKMAWQMNFLAVPMVLAGIGIALSLIGIFMVRTREGATFSELLKALGRPIWVTSMFVAVAAVAVVYFLLGMHFIGIAGSIIVGLFAGVWIGNRTEYYTSYDFKPTQGVSKQAEYGPATVIIDGVATGMWSTAWPVVTIAAAIALAYGFAGGFSNQVLGLYGVGLAAVGMLSTLGYTLATDAYGPIADNAGGNAQMADLDPGVRKRTDALDSLGNTTAATGKGFAIGSAALTALALIAAYLEEIRIGLLRAGSALVGEHMEGGAMKIATELPANTVTQLNSLNLTVNDQGYLALATVAGTPAVKNATFREFMDFYEVNLMNPMVLIGLFLGAMLAYAFCAMTMKAVGRAAGAMVAEVRRQFRSIPGIMDYTPGDKSEENMKRRPEYAKCVYISTAGAQREMILPSVMAVVVPIAVGLVFGVGGVVGLLGGALAGGFVLALMMANAGGAWDNAKKWIEHRDKLRLADVWSDDAEAKGKVAEAEKILGFDTNEDMKFRTRYSHTNPENVVTYTVGDEKKTCKIGEIWDNQELFHTVLKQKPELWDARPGRIIDGKGSYAHAAGVVGDTVGDPFKDTSGPSLNILIKLMAMVAVVFAGLTARYGAEFMAAWQQVFIKLGQ